jgi:hypothetical protein
VRSQNDRRHGALNKTVFDRWLCRDLLTANRLGGRLWLSSRNARDLATEAEVVILNDNHEAGRITMAQ